MGKSAAGYDCGHRVVWSVDFAIESRMPSQRQSPVDWSALAAEKDWAVPLPRFAGQPQPPMLFRRIPAGEFWMGSRGQGPHEEPRHRVVIPEDFWLGKFVVTQAQWAAVVAACKLTVESAGTGEGLKSRPSHSAEHRLPVVSVSWDDCVAWCGAWQAWLRRVRPKEWCAPLVVSLPSEAQWEYACRAGSETEYWNGDGEPALREVGWFAANSEFWIHAVDEPVVAGSPERHPAGLVGMHGNVSEWCADVFDAGAYRKHEDRWGAAKPWTDEDAAPQQYRCRVIRGGSWVGSAGGCRSAFRFRSGPDGRNGYQGFRVCLVRGPGSASSGGSAAAAGREAEAEQAQQDKASETRPQSSAAGEAGAPPRKTKVAAASKGSTKAVRAVKKPKAARRTTARKTKRKAARPAPKAPPQQKPAKKKGAGKRHGRGKGPGGGP